MASISSGPVGPVGRVRTAGRLGCLGLVAALASSLLAACSAGARTGDAKWGPPPEATTRAILVGELCERGTPCECRDEGSAGLGGVSGPDGSAPAGEERDEDLPGGDAEAAAPASVEHKRLELRLRSHHDLWLRVGELTFYKDRERPEACFYIDLPSPGTGEKPRRYDVELRGSNPDGVGAGLSISELGVAARSWYHTFRFACGAPGACSFEELDELKVAARRAVAEGALFDPCGSLKVRDVRWDTRVAPDHEFPGDLTLQLHLDVTNAVPDRRRGDPNCSAR